MRVGAAGESGWQAPLGRGFELQPLSDPTVLAPAQALSLRVLRDGVAVSGQPVTVRYETDSAPVVRISDGSGRVTFDFAKAGRYPVAATQLRRSIRPALEWESDFTTLTLAVHATP